MNNEFEISDDLKRILIKKFRRIIRRKDNETIMFFHIRIKKTQTSILNEINNWISNHEQVNIDRFKNVEPLYLTKRMDNYIECVFEVGCIEERTWKDWFIRKRKINDKRRTT